MTELASSAQLRMTFLRRALFVVPLVLLLGVVSGRASGSGYGNAWFAALAKPEAMPPAWVFPVAWTTLYILIGFALALILDARGARRRGVAIALFIAQLLLNYAWSPVFFALHEPRVALGIIGAMIVLAAAATFLFTRIRKTAALLMLPYLAWLCFAAYLNVGIVALNPGAETLVPRQASADIAL
jgi:tryptophan-rich sensory protein